MIEFTFRVTLKYAEAQAFIDESLDRAHSRVGENVKEILDGLPGLNLDNDPMVTNAAAEIRKRLEQQKSIQYLVPESVLGYIREHRLAKT